MVTDHSGHRLVVPDALVASHARYFDDTGWIAALPRLAADRLAGWELRPDGPPTCGDVALVLPVRCADDSPAVLKLQPVDEETGGEPIALRAWAGRGAVRLLRHDEASGSMLLERLDARRSLAGCRDEVAALRSLSELLARLSAVPAPAGIRRLSDVAAAMLDRVPDALPKLPDPAERRLIRRCAAVVRELLPDAGDRLLHWDLHYANVLATLPEPPSIEDTCWVAIDPKPLAGDPAFDLLPALHNRWDDVVATGDVPRAVRRRFDLMTEVLGLDRGRAVGWTLGRVLQEALWEAEHGGPCWQSEPNRAIVRTLLGGY